jgi:hypothetical protein
MKDQSLVDQFIDIRRNTAGIQLWVNAFHWEWPNMLNTVSILAVQRPSQATEEDVGPAANRGFGQ